MRSVTSRRRLWSRRLRLTSCFSALLEEILHRDVVFPSLEAPFLRSTGVYHLRIMPGFLGRLGEEALVLGEFGCFSCFRGCCWVYVLFCVVVWVFVFTGAWFVFWVVFLFGFVGAIAFGSDFAADVSLVNMTAC